MAFYNLVFLLDASSPTKLGQLIVWRILNCFACKYGMENIRWGYKWCEPRGKISRGSDFKELKVKNLEELEGEFRIKLDEISGMNHCEKLPSCSLAGKAILLQTALKEALLDFQWDRPDITSPTKPVPRGRRRGTVNSSVDDDPAVRKRNLLFILCACPQSITELEEFLSPVKLRRSGSFEGLADCLLPKRIKEIIFQNKVFLHWMDTTEYSKLLKCEDCSGYEAISKVMSQISGSLVPFEALLQLSVKNVRADTELLSREHSDNPISFLLQKKDAVIPVDSSLNCLMHSEQVYRAAFPMYQGKLHWDRAEDVKVIDVSLEALSSFQRPLTSCVKIILKSTVTDWNCSKSKILNTESWILHHTEDHLLQCFLVDLALRNLHMVVSVDFSSGFPPYTGVLSPLSPTTALLTVLLPRPLYEADELMNKVIVQSTDDTSSDLSDILSHVLKHNQQMEEHQNNSSDADISEIDYIVPEWVQQELKMSDSVTSTAVEDWFLMSDLAGISSNLMELIRLLSAVPEDEGGEVSEFDMTDCLSEMYQHSINKSSGRQNKKKRGVDCTPVRQKMKTMNRSLQMLNAARLNVKVQKSQADEHIISDINKHGKRRSADKLGDKEQTTCPTVDFRNEEDLSIYVKEIYEKMAAEQQCDIITQVQNCVKFIKAFFKSPNPQDLEMKCIEFIKRNLLKTSQAVRQQYGAVEDSEIKVKECQIQFVFRLEMCLQCPSIQSNAEDLEQIIEEMTDMLRMLSLTKNPAYLTQFLEEDILTVYVSLLPKVLGNMYYSLGTQIPKKLASVLPPDFFSDDSVVHESSSPAASLPSLAPSTASVAGECLEDLRCRSSRKKRGGVLSHHRSISDVSQSLQIEIPQKCTRRDSSKSRKSSVIKQPVLEDPKNAVQEVTKVRRNLFNQRSNPSAKVKLPRSQSVSAVDKLKQNGTQSKKNEMDCLKLRSRKVTETPLHKQVSNRLLYNQIKRRRSDSVSDISIVEESPLKPPPETDLRRSPRIKKLALSRRYSSSFYSSSQPVSRNLERVHSSSQLAFTDNKKGPFDVQTIKSPVRLLFGEVLSPKSKHSKQETNGRHSQSSEDHSAYKTPKKVLRSTSTKELSLSSNDRPSTRSFQTSPNTPTETPLKSKEKCKDSIFKSPCRRSPRLLQVTSVKEESPVNKLRTPVKRIEKSFSSPKLSILQSPLRSPKNLSVRWSPSLNVAESSSLTMNEICIEQTPEKVCTPRKSPHKPFMAKSLTQSFENCTPPRKLQRNEDFTTSSRSIKGPSTPKKPIETLQTNCKNRQNTVFSKKNMCTYQSFSPRKDCVDSINSTLNSTPQKACLISLKKTDFTKPSTSLRRSDRTNISFEDTLSNHETISTLKCSDTYPEISICQSGSSEKVLHNCITPGKMREKCDNVFTDDNLEETKFFGKNNLHYALEPTPIKSTNSDQNISKFKRKHLSKSKANENQLQADSDRKLIGKNLVNLKAANNSNLPSQDSSFSQCSQNESEDVFCGYIDSSQASAGGSNSFTTTEDDESIEISDATILKTQTSGGLKMNISFTRKPSKSNEAFEAACKSSLSNSGITYGFRLTPDRLQREAAARLRTPECPNKFTASRGSRSSNRAGCQATPNTPSYQVELEMQASGLPKLKFKRTDSLNAEDIAPDGGLKGMTSGSTSKRNSVLESPVSHCIKHRDTGYSSPSSLCSHGTPAKTTPGKAGIQTYICQSYTPNRHSSTTNSPSAVTDCAPWTPSPQSTGKSTPENLRNWPRRKKAMSGRSKKKWIFQGLPNEDNQNLKLLEDSDLDGIVWLQDVHAVNQSGLLNCSKKTSFGTKSKKRTSAEAFTPDKEEEQRGCKKASLFSSEVYSSTETESCSLMAKCEDFIMSSATPKSCKVRPVSASGLLALTQSPLLYKTPSSNKTCRGENKDFELSPWKREATSPLQVGEMISSEMNSKQLMAKKTYSRRKLLS
uniref:Treslin n=1 Tax=Erpetoichthys calabaricus TaxID=27687 RepID=A0A8C4TJU6_ERPCA